MINLVLLIAALGSKHVRI